jgi:phosphate uptake regulator
LQESLLDPVAGIGSRKVRAARRSIADVRRIVATITAVMDVSLILKRVDAPRHPQVDVMRAFEG